MKKFLLAGIIALVIVSTWYYIRHPLGKKAIINGHAINLEIAVTTAEKEKGLGGRDSLPTDNGMLFVYQHKDRYGFWMKGMRFPLDYIWIDGTTVVDLSKNVPPPKTPTEQPVSLAPLVPVDKVLEVNAGVVDKLGIRTGDTVRFIN